MGTLLFPQNLRTPKVLHPWREVSSTSAAADTTRAAQRHTPLKTIFTASTMKSIDSSNTNTWAVQHVLALVEIWALVA